MLKLAIKVAISAVLIWLLARSFDIATLFSQLAQVRIEGPLIAVLVLFALSTVQAWRWVWVFRALDMRVSFAKAWRIVLIGLFFNQTLPSSVGGDAARVWRVYRDGHSVVTAANSVILDRLVALAALLLIAVLGQPVIFGLVGDSPARWAVPIVVAAGLFGFAILLGFDRLPARLLRRGPGRAAALLSADARRLFLSPAHLLPVLALSMVIHAVVSLVVMLLAYALGMHVGVLDCLVLVPPVILMSMIPVTIAGWGVREGAMVTAFGLIGVPADKAFVLSVLFGLVVLVVSAPGGLVWLLTGRRAFGPLPATKPSAPSGPSNDGDEQNAL